MILKRLLNLFLAIGRPVWRQWPLFFALWLLLAPATFCEVGVLVEQGNWSLLSNYHWERLLVFASISFAMSYAVTCLVHYLHLSWKWRSGIYVVVLLNSLVYYFLLWNIYARFSPYLAIIISETNGGESSEFLETYLIALGTARAFAAVILAAAGIFAAELLKDKLRPRAGVIVKCAVSCVVLVCVTFGIANCRYVAGMLRCGTMVDLEKAPYFYIGNWDVDEVSNYLYVVHTLNLTADEIKEVVNRTAQAAARHEAQLENCDDSLNVVVVIGESYNRHHARLYGYDLPTTPCMEREQAAGNLIAFTDVISPYNTTSITLKNVFSCNSMADGEHWREKPMWPALFKSAGYNVLMWDNQIGTFSTASFTFSLNSVLYDRAVIESSYSACNSRSFAHDSTFVEDYFKHEPKIGRQPHNLVLLHLMGQHIAYQARYPQNGYWDRFTAADIKREAPYLKLEQKTVIANYANATFYNDALMGMIFDHYRNSNTVVIYFSDHGEEVFDYRNFMGRDHNISKSKDLMRNDNEIPFIIWLSPVYKAKHPEIFNRFKAAANLPFTNDDLSNILFDLGCLKTKYYQSHRNPLSSDFKAGKRMIYDKYDYDELMKKSQ